MSPLGYQVARILLEAALARVRIHSSDRRKADEKERPAAANDEPKITTRDGESRRR